jgi:PAS domain S-box-containing protein
MVRPTGVEQMLGEEELIVSKTDLKGRISYANDVFIRMAKYPAHELIGAPHSIIRHPDMPRCVFKLLWDTIEARQEIFAYVVNLAADGSHYWVFAHVTPTFDGEGKVVGYHSNRRKPERAPLKKVKPIYKLLREEEARHANAKEGLRAGFDMMIDFLKKQGLAYDEFVLSL